MNYRVEWTPSAHDRLERIWMAAPDKAAVMRAANRIDYLLAEDPHQDEACQLGDENSLIVEPLAVDYEVFEER